MAFPPGNRFVVDVQGVPGVSRSPEAPAAPSGDEDDITVAKPPPVPGPGDLQPGTMLGEYRIERKLGEGGMGTVFAAVHPVIGKRAAIKILNQQMCRDPHAVTRFVDEARVVNQIGHPNIVDVFAFGAIPDGRHYYVMELLQGETLGARMARRPLTLAETCAVVKTLCRALEAAHDHGVVHRDLKPDNVFLVERRDEPWVVKLLDFGIAKLSQDYPLDRTLAGTMMGTPQYMAPEQARGHGVDVRADIYALGGIAFELLAGRPVFIADNTPEFIAMHMIEAPPRPSQFARVSAELDDLVVAMLAKKPASRPPLARIHDAFDRALAALSQPVIVARPPTSAAIPFAATTRLEIEPMAAPVAVPLPRPPTTQPALTRRASPRRIALPIAVLSFVAIASLLVVRSLTRASVERAPAVARDLEPTPPARVAPSAEPAPPAPPRSEPAAPAPSSDREPVSDPVAAPATSDARPPADEHRSAEHTLRVDGKHRAPAAGHLALTIHGAHDFLVLVDGKSQAQRTELALPPGAHRVEIRAAGELPQRFTVQIEPGASLQRDVAWAHAPPRSDTGDGHELMAPGDAVPKGQR